MDKSQEVSSGPWVIIEPRWKARPSPSHAFVRFSTTEKSPQDYYRAVYLSRRTIRHPMKQIPAKQRIDPARIVRLMRVNENGMRILVDDDVVRELPEGQDMDVGISEASGADGNFAHGD